MTICHYDTFVNETNVNMKTTITSLKIDQILGAEVLRQIQDKIMALENICSSEVDVSIDKLSIRTNFIDDNQIEKNFKKKDAKGSRYYKHRLKYEHKFVSKASVMIFMNSRSKKGQYAHKIEVNPKHLPYAELLRVLKEVLGRRGLAEHMICRLDISFRIVSDSVTVDGFYYACCVKWKHYSGQYKEPSLEEDDKSREDVTSNSGNLSTFMCGKNPLRLSVYNQNHKRKAPEKGVNFELQFFGEKVRRHLGVEQLVDLPSIVKSNPLGLVQFVNVSAVKNRNLSRSRTKKLSDGICQIHSLGLHTGRAKAIKTISRKFDSEVMENFVRIKHRESGGSLKKFLHQKFEKDLEEYFRKKMTNCQTDN